MELGSIASSEVRETHAFTFSSAIIAATIAAKEGVLH